MIDYLFSLLLVPIFPQLADPVLTHAVAMKELEDRLLWGRNPPPVKSGSIPSINLSEELNSNPANLPPISGRLLEWSSSQVAEEQNRQFVIGLSAGLLRLTGMIEASGQRAAILNDGQQDHVVGVGSYVLNAYRVASIGKEQIVLMAVDPRLGNKRLELNLIASASVATEEKK
jgi:hypothetical protein